MGASPPQINDASVTLSFGAAGVYYGYCTIADVNYEFVNKASMSTLTNSVIAQEITYAAEEMQQQIDPKYVMPYTGSDAGILLTLREINAKLAASRVIDRYYRGSENKAAADAVELRQFAEMVILDVVKGIVQWAAPFGDATPRAEKPTYPRAAGATVMPNPNDADPNTAQPIFKIGANRYRRTQSW